MSVSAQTVYRDQFIAAFERRDSVLRQACTTETETRAGSIVFLVASSGASGGRSAVTRGPNGKIPASDDVQTPVTLTFAEDHDKNIKTGFDVFRAQSNQLEIMRMNGMGVINRKIDSRILVEAATTTVDLGAVGAMNKTVANKVVVKLRNAFVGEAGGGMIYSVLTPSAYAYMTDITSFASADYTAKNKLDAGMPDMGYWVDWMGVKWTVHSGLTGMGTSTATCLAWHKAAIGHAIAPGGVDAYIGRNEEDDYSVVRHTAYNAAKMLQGTGVVKFTHDDSGLS